MKITYDDDTILNFGKAHRGKKLSEVPDSYLQWLFYDAGLKPGPLKDYLAENIESINHNVLNQTEEQYLS